jgi:predicted nucleic acid-binding protein
MAAVPPRPVVLNATPLSNFAFIDRLDLLAIFAGVCTVPVVEEELVAGSDEYGYLDRALGGLDDTIPVIRISEAVAACEADLRGQIDAGEAQALAAAAVHDGWIVTDDGDARTLADDHDIPYTGSIGVLLRAVESGRIDAATADQWLKRWIDETGFRAPSREFADYR